MPKKLDLTGQIYGWLTVLYEHKEKKKCGNRYIIQWVCQCKCGNEVIVPTRALREKHKMSCGCMLRSVENMSYTRPWRIWFGMKDRCKRKNNTRYKYYGGRGISYDTRWEDFNVFWEDMKDGYKDDLTLDRIDYDKNYCKENCRWVNQTIQVRNKRNTKLINYNGATKPLIEFAEEYGLTYGQAYDRVRRGWDLDRIFTQPLGDRSRKNK